MNDKELRLAGMNVAEFLNRIMNNERLVALFVKKFLEDNTYAKLTAAIERGDGREAEFACHSLKGMCGNLSLTALFEAFQAQLGLFRGGEYEKAVEKMESIAPAYENAITHMKKWLAENDA